MTHKQKESLSVLGLTWATTLMLAGVAAMAMFIGCRAAYGQVRTDTDRFECQWYDKENLFLADEDLLIFSNDESMAAIVLYRPIPGTGGSADWHVVVLEIPTCRTIQTIPSKADRDIWSIAFSPNNKDIAVLINDGRILVYDARTGEENRDQQIRYRQVVDKPSHPWYARHIQFSRDGNEIFLLAGSTPYDISIITFPLSNWKNGWSEVPYSDSGTYTHFYYWPHSHVQFSPDHKYVVVEFSRSSIPRSNAPHRYVELHVYDLEAGERVCYTEVYGLKSIDWFPDASSIVASVEDRDYSAIRSISTISLLPSGPEQKCIVQADEWNDNGEGLLVLLQLDATYSLLRRRDQNGRWSGFHEIYDLANKEKVDEFAVLDSSSGKKTGFSEYVLSPNGNYFAGLRRGDNVPAGLVLFHWNSISRTSTEEVPALAELHVYPNPAVDRVTFTQAGQIQLFDLLGRQVLDKAIRRQEPVEVKHLPAGLYLYQFTSESGIASGKLIKQ